MNDFETFSNSSRLRRRIYTVNDDLVDLVIEPNTAIIGSDNIIRSFKLEFNDGTYDWFQLARIDGSDLVDRIAEFSTFAVLFGVAETRGAFHKSLPNGADLPIRIASFVGSYFAGQFVRKVVSDIRTSSSQWGYFSATDKKQYFKNYILLT